MLGQLCISPKLPVFGADSSLVGQALSLELAFLFDFRRNVLMR
jgi:hypothetical protein